MKIRDILSKYYEDFLAMCTKKEVAIYGGKTSEDILNEAMITAINHFGEQDITEEEGYEYAKKTFLMEAQFSYKKKCRPEEKMIEYTPDYPTNY